MEQDDVLGIKSANSVAVCVRLKVPIARLSLWVLEVFKGWLEEPGRQVIRLAQQSEGFPHPRHGANVERFRWRYLASASQRPSLLVLESEVSERKEVEPLDAWSCRLSLRDGLIQLAVMRNEKCRAWLMACLYLVFTQLRAKLRKELKNVALAQPGERGPHPGKGTPGLPALGGILLVRSSLNLKESLGFR